MEEINKKAAFDKGMQRTQTHFLSRLSRALIGKQTIDQEHLDSLEEALLAADVGLDTTTQIVSRLHTRVRKQKYVGKTQLMQLLHQEMQTCFSAKTLPPFHVTETPPHIILLVGVNGTGKTTTAARLAYAYQQQGASVVLGAADTFRAAAVTQLQRWGEKLKLPVVTKSAGTDPSAVAFATTSYAIDNHTQVGIIDTAGRLHNKKPLMDELNKLYRVIGKALPHAPHEVLLVLDASTGQNAFVQTEVFAAATRLTGLVVTKLDGTAKGGVLIGIAAKYNLPIRYVGMGESLADLHPFQRDQYIATLLNT